MEQRVIAIDQSTSATKALLFTAGGRRRLLDRCNIEHRQIYPQAGWVEHDAEEIYANTVKAIAGVMSGAAGRQTMEYSLAITNQRETVAVWDRETGKPIYNAIVWQDTRGAGLCRHLREQGCEKTVREKTGLKIDPSFSSSKAAWIINNIPGALQKARKGNLLMGTIDCWLIWRLTNGRTFATDYTNASRTMLFNIHTMDWDDDMLRLFNIPRSMLPELRPSDAVFGETTVEGLFCKPITIAGVLGDSHAALAGQMCFGEGQAKVTYGTGSSVMVNIGARPLEAPEGLVTSVAFTALGSTSFAFEGNIYSTGATLKWLTDNLRLIDSPGESEALAMEVADNGGVYFIPAFAGLGAPWWADDVKGAIVGLTFNTTRAHIVRAAVESIAYQVKDLISAMTRATTLKEICADGGPTSNRFLMRMQADILGTPILCTEVEDASALGAAVMNSFARGLSASFEEASRERKVTARVLPRDGSRYENGYALWRKAVKELIKR